MSAAGVESLQKQLDVSSAKGNLGAARAAANDLAVLFKKTGAKESQAKVLQTSAELCLATGNFQGALRAANEATKLFRSLGDKTSEAGALQTTANVLLASPVAVQDALSLATEALAIVRGLKSKEKLGSVLTTVAQAHFARGEQKSTLKVADEALKIYRELGDKKGEASVLQTMAEAHLARLPKKENRKKAMQEARDAMTLFKAVGDKRGEAAALLTVARGQLELDPIDQEGRKLAKEAAELFWQVGDEKGAALASSMVASVAATQTRVEPPKLVKPIPRKNNEPRISFNAIVGTSELKVMAGRIACVTGGSRGIGKGVCEALATAGCTVYVTGRSSTGNVTDILMGGTVDETASMLAKAGGYGVAVHADHAQLEVNKSLARLIQEQHGRLDLLVNNAFYISKPDSLFFMSRVWSQPSRFLNEQYSVGGYDKGTLTLLNLSNLRRGAGFVVNVGSWGSQINLTIFPVSYLLNKAAYDQTSAALGTRLAKYNICVVLFWPGNIRSERSIVASKKNSMDFGLDNAESVRFTGKAIVLLTTVPPETKMRYNGRMVAAFDVYTPGNSHDTDGYVHEPNEHSVYSLHTTG